MKDPEVSGEDHSCNWPVPLSKVVESPVEGLIVQTKSAKALSTSLTCSCRLRVRVSPSAKTSESANSKTGGSLTAWISMMPWSLSESPKGSVAVTVKVSMPNQSASGKMIMLSLVAETLAFIWLLEKVKVKVVSSGSATIAEKSVRKPIGSSSLSTSGGKSTTGGSLTTLIVRVSEIRLSRLPPTPLVSSSAKSRIFSSSVAVL